MPEFIAGTVWNSPCEYIYDNPFVSLPVYLEAKMPIDDVTANEIRSSSLQGFAQWRDELFSSHRHFTDLLKATSVQAFRELDTLESRANERLLNSPPIPNVGP